MGNPLVEEAEKLGGHQRWQAQGMLPVVKMSNQGKWKGERVVVYLQFYSPGELVELVAWAISNGYMPYSGDVFSQADFGMGEKVSGEVPHCPIHKRPMVASKKYKGWFCAERVQGGYCPETA